MKDRSTHALPADAGMTPYKAYVQALELEQKLAEHDVAFHRVWGQMKASMELTRAGLDAEVATARERKVSVFRIDLPLLASRIASFPSLESVRLPGSNMEYTWKPTSGGHQKLVAVDSIGKSHTLGNSRMLPSSQSHSFASPATAQGSGNSVQHASSWNDVSAVDEQFFHDLPVLLQRVHTMAVREADPALRSLGLNYLADTCSSAQDVALVDALAALPLPATIPDSDVQSVERFNRVSETRIDPEFWLSTMQAIPRAVQQRAIAAAAAEKICSSLAAFGTRGKTYSVGGHKYAVIEQQATREEVLDKHRYVIRSGPIRPWITMDGTILDIRSKSAPELAPLIKDAKRIFKELGVFAHVTRLNSTGGQFSAPPLEM